MGAILDARFLNNQILMNNVSSQIVTKCTQSTCLFWTNTYVLSQAKPFCIHIFCATTTHRIRNINEDESKDAKPINISSRSGEISVAK